MEMICPPLPAPEGKQTNCWRLILVGQILNHISNLASGLGVSGNEGNAIWSFIQNMVFTIAYLYHLQYVVIEVSGEMVEIKGGPCRWCEAWTKEGKALKFISPYYCTSTQIRKDEVVSVSKHIRAGFGDYFPNCFCEPLLWCCCYKSYSAYQWPLCCIVNIAGQCEGDTPTNDMVEIVLNHKKWNLNLYTLCYYDKVIVSYKEESIFDQFRSNGYPLQVADAQPNTNTNTNGQTNNTQGQTA